MSDHPLLTVAEVACWLQIHRTTAYRLANKGKIPAIRIAGSWRFNVDAIEEWMKS